MLGEDQHTFRVFWFSQASRKSLEYLSGISCIRCTTTFALTFTTFLCSLSLSCLAVPSTLITCSSSNRLCVTTCSETIEPIFCLLFFLLFLNWISRCTTTETCPLFSFLCAILFTFYINYNNSYRNRNNINRANYELGFLTIVWCVNGGDFDACSLRSKLNTRWSALTSLRSPGYGVWYSPDSEVSLHQILAENQWTKWTSSIQLN